MMNAFIIKKRIQSSSPGNEMQYSNFQTNNYSTNNEASIDNDDEFFRQKIGKQKTDLRNRLAFASKKRAEAWANATIGNELAHTLNEGTINLRHPNNYEFRDSKNKIFRSQILSRK